MSRDKALFGRRSSGAVSPAAELLAGLEDSGHVEDHREGRGRAAAQRSSAGTSGAVGGEGDKRTQAMMSKLRDRERELRDERNQAEQALRAEVVRGSEVEKQLAQAKRELEAQQRRLEGQERQLEAQQRQLEAQQGQLEAQDAAATEGVSSVVAAPAPARRGKMRTVKVQCDLGGSKRGSTEAGSASDPLAAFASSEARKDVKRALEQGRAEGLAEVEALRARAEAAEAQAGETEALRARAEAAEARAGEAEAASAAAEARSKEARKFAGEAGARAAEAEARALAAEERARAAVAIGPSSGEAEGEGSLPKPQAKEKVQKGSSAASSAAALALVARRPETADRGSQAEDGALQSLAEELTGAKRKLKHALVELQAARRRLLDADETAQQLAEAEAELDDFIKEVKELRAEIKSRDKELRALAKERDLFKEAAGDDGVRLVKRVAEAERNVAQQVATRVQQEVARVTQTFQSAMTTQAVAAQRQRAELEEAAQRAQDRLVNAQARLALAEERDGDFGVKAVGAGAAAAAAAAKKSGAPPGAIKKTDWMAKKTEGAARGGRFLAKAKKGNRRA